MTNRAVLAINLLDVSQILMDLTLGHLLRAIRWHARNDAVGMYICGAKGSSHEG